MPFPPTHPALERALAARGYAEPTEVQSAVLEADGAADRDLLVSAQTGSGKTVAYGLAFATTLLGDAARFGPPGPPLALIIAPTRELALQVHGELGWLYEFTGARVAACVGGMDARREQRALAAGCHIVVGTPGRLRDHLERRQLDLSAARVIVLDEADEMLDLGFRDDLQFILDAAPPARRTLLFSATIPREIATLARQYQQNAIRIDTVNRTVPHADIEYRAIRVAAHEVEKAVVNVLRAADVRAALVFCATREGVRRLHSRLVERGFGAVALSGELSQHERSSALQALRDGRARVCVATDVAARGLDLPDLGLVLHADLPTNRETLLHRSGRTGRAGRKGVSVLLVPPVKRRRAEQLIASAGVSARWSGPPTASEIAQRDQERLLADPVLADPPTDDELTLAQTLLDGRTPEAIAAGLIRLYRAQLPAPEVLAEVAAPDPNRRDTPRDPASMRARRTDQGPMAWFRMSLGRRDNADPKWLIPMLCRLGHLTKQDIGTIQVFDQETRFQITTEAASRFAAAAAADENLRIALVGAANASPPAAFKPRFGHKPGREAARGHSSRRRADPA